MVESRPKRIERCKLRSYMHRDAQRADMGHAGCPGIKRRRNIDVKSELIVLPPGGYLVMSVCIHVWIYTKGDHRVRTSRLSDLG